MNTTLQPKQSRAALIACRDSKAQVESVIRHAGHDPRDFLIISRKDNPRLKTLDDIIAALPGSVQLVVLDDVEHLLPENERTRAKVFALLEGARIRYAHRRITFYASITDNQLSGLTEIWRRRP